MVWPICHLWKFLVNPTFLKVDCGVTASTFYLFLIHIQDDALDLKDVDFQTLCQLHNLALKFDQISFQTRLLKQVEELLDEASPCDLVHLAALLETHKVSQTRPFVEAKLMKIKIDDHLPDLVDLVDQDGVQSKVKFSWSSRWSGLLSGQLSSHWSKLLVLSLVRSPSNIWYSNYLTTDSWVPPGRLSQQELHIPSTSCLQNPWLLS